MRHLLFVVLAISNLIFYSEAIDLCIFLNNCPPGSPFHNPNNNNNAREDSGVAIPNIIQGKDGWIEPQQDADHNQIYYFANDAPGMNWYDADEYCHDKGGFLAEPLTTQENDFLKGHARSLGKSNWWIGLREAENCKCTSTDARSSARATVSFDANIDYNSLTSRSQNGLVKTKCPSFGTYSKQCSGKVHIWSYSGIRSSFTDWDAGEPNGDPEHCTVLWAKVGNRWADWSCTTVRDGDSYLFKPLCQKDKDSPDLTIPDPTTAAPTTSTTTVRIPTTTSDNDRILPDLLQCVDTGVNYKSKPDGKLQKINGIESADLCREICSETDGCLYWTWLQKARKNVCKLKSNVINTGFRRHKNNAVSGTMLNGCNPIDGANGGSGGNLENSEYCVEYGAIYIGGNQRPNVVRNINSEIECRNRCIQTNGCKYFTWKTGKRKNNCELRSNNDFEVKASKKGTSGSVLGKCKDQSFDQMTQCNCVSLNNQNNDNQPGGGINSNQPSLVDILNGAPGGIDGNRPSLVDILGAPPGQNQPSLDDILNGGGFDGRSVNSNQDARRGGDGCPKNFINRCGFSRNQVTPTTVRPEKVEKGEYCIDHEVDYQEGDEFKTINNVKSVESCRQECLSENKCQFYVWKGFSRSKTCHLKASGIWLPAYESGTVSGSVNGECKFQTADSYGFCDCVELVPDYYDDYVDLVETGFINERTNTCPTNQGRRCYAKIPIGGIVTTTTTTTTVRPERVQKGEYCIDHDVNYQEGDEFRSINNIGSVESCRQQCLSENECQFYVWKGFSRSKTCHLKASGIWLPEYESGTVSGSIDGDCRFQTADSYGFCDCVELVPDYYDEDFLDLVETGLINQRTNICPSDQGRRCYAKIPIALPDSDINVSGLGRISFGN